jgi:hypothetical protein
MKHLKIRIGLACYLVAKAADRLVQFVTEQVDLAIEALYRTSHLIENLCAEESLPSATFNLCFFAVVIDCGWKNLVQALLPRTIFERFNGEFLISRTEVAMLLE